MALTESQLSELNEAQLLDLIIEEAAEVIHAASKCKRFRSDGCHPSYNGGRSNADQLAREFRQVKETFRAYCGRVGMSYRDAYEGKIEDDLLQN